MTRADASRAVVPAFIAATSAAAWIILWRLGESPWGRWAHVHGGISHDAMTHLSSNVALGSAFIGGWVVMTIAMMLPTTMPLVQIFRRLTSQRADGLLLVLLLVSGYLAVWTAFGVAVYGAATLTQNFAISNEWLTAHPRVPSAALLFIAGAFQFSALKYRCLDKCRSPMSFVSSRWRGTHERWQSLRLGGEHGAFCVGCCWALMLLMFAAGTASLLWMLALGGVMAAEKNLPWGRQLSKPIGIVLFVAGAIVMARM